MHYSPTSGPGAQGPPFGERKQGFTEATRCTVRKNGKLSMNYMLFIKKRFESFVLMFLMKPFKNWNYGHFKLLLGHCFHVVTITAWRDSREAAQVTNAIFQTSFSLARAPPTNRQPIMLVGSFPQLATFPAKEGTFPAITVIFFHHSLRRYKT